MKNLLCFILINSVIFLTCCYHPERVTKDYPEFLQEEVDVKLTMIDSSQYYLDKKTIKLKMIQ